MDNNYNSDDYSTEKSNNIIKKVVVVKGYTWVAESYGIVGHYRFDILVPEISTTEDKTYSITRRFSEIEWLYKMLLVFAAGSKIPKLPEKHIWTNFVSHPTSIIETRKKEISDFLTIIHNHYYLANTKCYEDFISVEGRINYGLTEKKGIVNSAKQVFNYFGYGLNNSSNNSSSNNNNSLNFFDDLQLYSEDDKFNMQRLFQGTKDVLKAYEEQQKIIKDRNESIESIYNSSLKISKSYNKKKLGNIANDIDVNKNNSNENTNIIYDSERIFNVNNNYMLEIKNANNNFIKKINNNIEELKVSFFVKYYICILQIIKNIKYIYIIKNYKDSLECIIEIFNRLDNLNIEEISNLIKKGVLDISKESLAIKYKEQLKHEISIFKSKEEDKIIKLIEKIYIDKVKLSIEIKNIFNSDNKSQELNIENNYDLIEK